MTQLAERQNIIRATGIVGITTFASRISGFIRDIVIAYFFGAGVCSDAFFIAYRIPNLLRRLFAEGALSVAFVPIFAEEMANHDKKEAFELVQALFPLLTLILLLVCLIGIYYAPFLVRIIAPGFISQEIIIKLTISLTRWCFPYIFFISLAALAAGVLNYLNFFFAPAASTILLNLSMIICVVFLSQKVEPAILSLALGVLIGGLAQLIFQIFYLYKKAEFPLRLLWKPSHPSIKRIFILMIPAIFGASIYQITVLFNTIVASFLPYGTVSYLYYADRIAEFPLGIFGIALTTAVLPSFSRQIAIDNYQFFIEIVEYSLRISMFIHLPSTIGLIILAEPLVFLLFGRGEFELAAVHATALALISYSVGLWAFASYRIIAQAFYAIKDTYTPVKIGIWCLLVNIFLSLGLVPFLSYIGLALSTSISSIINMLLLLYHLKKRFRSINIKKFFRSSGINFLASIFMGLIIIAVVYLPSWGNELSWSYKWLRPILGIIVGSVVYLSIGWFFNMSEIKNIMNHNFLGRDKN